MGRRCRSWGPAGRRAFCRRRWCGPGRSPHLARPCSRLLPRLAWLTALACFSFFCVVTLYKALTGAASCGCFGSVSVPPWITLLAIDLPAVLALSLFRPQGVLAPVLPLLRRQQPIRTALSTFFKPLWASSRLLLTAGSMFVVLSTVAPVLAFYEPPAVTSTYEVLEPKTWIGKELPILEHIDIAEQIKTGNWLLLFYHHDCPDCQKAIPQYEQMARDLAGSEELLRIALIEVPPYGPGTIRDSSRCVFGRLAAAKEWFVTSPAVVLLADAAVGAAWEEQAPDFPSILAILAATKVMIDVGPPDSVSRPNRNAIERR